MKHNDAQARLDKWWRTNYHSTWKYYQVVGYSENLTPYIVDLRDPGCKREKRKAREAIQRIANYNRSKGRQCANCGKPIHNNSKSGMCTRCVKPQACAKRNENRAKARNTSALAS